MTGPIAAGRRLIQRAVFRQGSIVLVDQGLLSFTNFLTGVLVARATTTEDYGTYVLAGSVLVIALSLYRALVHVPFTVFLPRLPPADADRFQGSAFIQALAVAAAAASAVALSPWLMPSPGDSGGAISLSLVASVVAVLLFPYLLREFARDALFARLRFRASILISILATSGQLAAVIILYLRGELGVVTALSIVGATSVLAASLMLWLHRDHMVMRLSAVWSDFLSGWHISRWSLLNVAGMIGTAQVFPWLLLAHRSAREVAIFGAATVLSTVMAPFLQAANAYVLPRMSHAFVGGDRMVLRRMLRMSMLGLLVPYGAWALVGGFFADELMVLLFSDRFAGFGSVVVLLLVRAVIESASAPMNLALQALEQNQVTTQALLLGSLLTFTVGWWAIATFGLIGAAAAAVMSAIVVSTYRYWRLRRLLAPGAARLPA